jgi:hypothetical protein
MKEWKQGAGKNERPEEDWKRIMNCEKEKSCEKCLGFFGTKKEKSD